MASTSLITATPLATFHVVGDLSEPGSSYYLDYIWKAPSWTTSPAGTLLGVVALVVVVTSILLIGNELRLRRIHPPILTVNALSVAAGMLLGWWYRIMTAGVGGANIGAGLVIIFGTPLFLVLVVSAIVISIRSSGHQRAHELGG